MSKPQYSFDDRNPLYHQRRRARGLLEKYRQGCSFAALDQAAKLEQVTHTAAGKKWPVEPVELPGYDSRLFEENHELST